MEPRERIIVIGAGVAGLGAARRLAEAGREVTVLEARDRIGGRIHTERVAGVALELGADFVHGDPPELLEVIEEAGLKLSSDDSDGFVAKDGVLKKSEGHGPAPYGVLAQVDTAEREETVGALLDRQALPPEARAALGFFLDSFNAADHTRMSVRGLARQRQGERGVGGTSGRHVEGGYDQVPAFLARRAEEHGATIRTGAPVTAVVWNRGAVEVVAGERFTADRLVVAAPLGVLKAGLISFDPAPTAHLAAIATLEPGEAHLVALVFRSPFWERLTPTPTRASTKGLGFLRVDDTPAVWWTRPRAATAITGWAGGPTSRVLRGDPAAFTERAIGVLARAFQIPRADVGSELVTARANDWHGDPWTRGAYAWIPAFGLESMEKLGEPVEDTLFFAGEHTDATGTFGTVHGALRSGLRAADAILRR